MEASRPIVVPLFRVWSYLLAAWNIGTVWDGLGLPVGRSVRGNGIRGPTSSPPTTDVRATDRQSAGTGSILQHF